MQEQKVAIKKSRRIRGNRGKKPFNPFASSATTDKHLAIGDPKQPKHFHNRLSQRTKDEEEADEVIRRLHATAKANRLGTKQRPDHTYGIITHKFPEGERKQANGADADMLLSIVQHMQHSEYDEGAGPVATTMMDAAKGRPLEDSISHIIDASESPAAKPVVRTAYGDWLKSRPMEIAMRLLKMGEWDKESETMSGPLGLLSANELWELSALGEDPEVVEHYLGEHRPLTPEEHEAVIDSAINAQVDEGDASHPKGISHEENVKQFEERGGRPVNWNFNVGGQFGFEDEEGEMHFAKPRPSVSPLAQGKATTYFPNVPREPEILANQPWPMDFTTEYKGEPMDIAMQLLKRAKSKEALANKRKYDTNYHATPERKKYRVDLKRERRQRGVYGKGGKDMSHTKDGKLTPEDPSSNRARQNKAKGTLK